MRKLIALAMVFCFLFGCASSTLIRSYPPDAKLYLDGQLKRETPYTCSDREAGTMMGLGPFKRSNQQGEVSGFARSSSV